MNKMKTMTAGLVAAVAFGSLAFMPANADSLESPAQPAPAAVAPLNSPETPQALTWDMSYGQLTPPER